MSKLHQIFINIGVLLSYVSNLLFAPLPPQLGWRVMFAAGAVPPVFLALAVLAMPESPRWLVLQGKVDEARKVLERTSDSPEDVEIRLAEIREAAGIAILPHGSFGSSGDVAMPMLNKPAGGGGGTDGTWADLLIHATPSVRFVLIAAVGLQLNQVVSFIVFSFLDVLDVVLCLAYKLADYAVEAEWKPCYCSSTAKDMILTAGGAAAGGMSKVVCLCSRKLQLEDISDTLYVRPSLVSDVSRSTVRELRRLKTERRSQGGRARIVATTASTSFTISSSIVEMLQGRIGGQQPHPIPRWSDCGCKKCST